MDIEKKNYSSPRDEAYAATLEWCTRLGLGFLLLFFTFYVTGLFEPAVSFEELPNYWTRSASGYMDKTGIQTGWDWIYHLHQGDHLALLGPALLASISIICLTRVLPFSWREKDWIFGIIVLLEIGVLLLAASGVLVAGH